MTPEYEAYMLSEEWDYLKRHHPAARKCFACDYAHNLRLHHMRYPKDITKTRWTDCCWLCDGCHAAFHRACTGEREKYKAWATESWKVKMLVDAQRKEEEYQPVGNLLVTMFERMKVTGGMQ